MAGVKKTGKNSWLVNGDVPIRDLNREFEWNLPEDDEYSTIAGLILFESKTLPSIGQKFNFYDLQFEIKRKNRNQITQILIKAPKEENMK